MTATSKRRLMRLEENPDVQYRQELARLRRLDALTTDELMKELHDLHARGQDIGDVPDRQVIDLALRFTDEWTPEERAVMDRLQEGAISLQKQAKRNLAGIERYNILPQGVTPSEVQIWVRAVYRRRNKVMELEEV